MHAHCGTNDSVQSWSFMDVVTLDLRPGVRKESASAAWLGALVVSVLCKRGFF